MTTRYLTINRTFKVDDTLADVTTALLSDATGTYGVWNNTDDVKLVNDGTEMTHVSTGVYQYSFEAEWDHAYTAWVELTYGTSVYRYEHEFAAVSESSSEIMHASYNTLLERIGHHLFGIRSSFSSDQTDDVLECIRDGLHDVYTAHNWSFFRPVKYITTTAPYTTGTVEIVDGVVTLTTGTFPSWAASGVMCVGDDYYEVDTRDGDTQVTLEDTTVDVDAGTSYSLARPEYSLPTSCEAISGEIAYQQGQADLYPPITAKDDSAIRHMQQDDPYNDRPIYYSTRATEFDATAGSLRTLVFYPTPDAAYVLKVRMVLRPTMIDSTNLYPVGAESLTQVITEACLAAAERNYDGEEGVHTRRFQELLPLAIAADQEKTTPTVLGRDEPEGEYADRDFRMMTMGDITINGTVY